MKCLGRKNLNCWSWLRVEVTRQRIIGEAFNHQRPFALRSWKLTQNRERFLFWDTWVLPIFFWHRKNGFDHWRCFFGDLGSGLSFCWDFHWDFWVLSSSFVQSLGVYDRLIDTDTVLPSSVEKWSFFGETPSSTSLLTVHFYGKAKHQTHLVASTSLGLVALH